MSRRITGFLVLLMALALVGTMSAQVLKGSISGTVVDPQGAVISGASVKATNDTTGISYTANSDASGLFRFNLIPAGNYKVEITHGKDYKTLVRNNVQVTPGADTGLGSMKMELGSMETTVEVKAEAPLVTTTEAQITNAFAGTSLNTFVGTQENQGLDNMALFVPGAVNSRDEGFSNTNGAGFTVNGIRPRNNDQQIDGQNNNDNSVGGPSLFVSDTEWVSQYVVTTNNFGPEYGRNSGSVVNVITKSGGNAWHGSIYGSENNSVLNAFDNQDKRFNVTPVNCNAAKDCQTVPLTKLPHLNNEFAGFSIGGPWIKNKVFFFGDFNQQIINTTGNIHTNDLAPTPTGMARLNACFPGVASLAAWTNFGPFGVTGGNPVATTVPLDASNPQSVQGFVPLDIINSTGVSCDNVEFGGVSRFLPQPVHNFNFIWKNDIQLGNDNISARYLFNRGNFFNLDFGNAAGGYPVNEPALSQATQVDWTHNFGSRMVNEARVSFNRLNVDFGGNTIGTLPTGDHLDQAIAQVTFRFPGSFEQGGSSVCPGGVCPPGGYFPSQLPPGYAFVSMGAANNLPQFRIVNTWQAQDNWTYVAGKHTLKAGVNFTYQRSPNGFLPNVDSTFRYDEWSSFFGAGGSSMTSNRPDRVRIAKGPTGVDFREYDTFLYVGDDWKVNQNLTLNLGLTWSYYGQPANLFHDITTKQQTGPAPFWNPALPTSITTFPTFPAPKNSFGPSIGFAYNPQWGGFLTGHGKTTIRGGYRLAYDPPYYNIYLNMATAAPQTFLQSFTGGAARSKPMNAVPTGPNERADLSSFLTPGVFDPRTFNETSMSPDFGPDKVHSWSFGVQRQIGNNVAVEARYVGNHSLDLFQTINGNPRIDQLAAKFPQFTAGLTPCAATQQVGPGAGTDVGRVNCGQGVLRERTNTGYSDYNGLQTEFRANNLFKQLTIKAGYTFSKTTDNVSEIFSTAGAGNTTAISQNPLDFKTGEHGFSGLDTPHVFTFTANEALPFMKDQKGALGHVFGGWSISGNYIWASGERWTPSQLFMAEFTAPDFYDAAFYNAFFGLEPARPFSGNPNAPVGAVGIYAGDACTSFANFGTEWYCGVAPTTLVSLNAVNSAPFGPVVTVTPNDVRYIANTGLAQTVFGTPFGNVGRNVEQDAPQNIANISVTKRIKITERTAFEFHTSFFNAFNHFNFSSVDPFLEDAGLTASFTGFGDPSTTNANGRQITFGGKFTF